MSMYICLLFCLSLPQLSSSQLNSASHLGTSVPSIPDYVYSQLAPPTVVSPEGKKLHVDICAVSTRGKTFPLKTWKKIM